MTINDINILICIMSTDGWTTTPHLAIALKKSPFERYPYFVISKNLNALERKESILYLDLDF